VSPIVLCSAQALRRAPSSFSSNRSFFQPRSATRGIGPRDLNLFESTVHRQFSGFGEHDKWDNQFLVIATLFFGIVRNHPFHDANKRTGLLSMLFHLEKISKCMTMNDQELEDFTVDMADRKLERHHLRRNRRKRLRDVDAEVTFVAQWLRRKSRNVDNEYRDISYNRLWTILNRYGYDIVNPQDNHIDLVQDRRKKRVLSFRRKETYNEKNSQDWVSFMEIYCAERRNEGRARSGGSDIREGRRF
jgi:death-on-curing family protein